MQQIDPGDVENSLEDCTRHQGKFLRTANAFHVKGDDEFTRSEAIVFMIIGGRIPSVTEMSTDEYGLRSMQEIDPVSLIVSPRQWESMYGTDLSNEKNAES